MKKYQPVQLPKHWLTNKLDKKPFEFSSDSAIGIVLGPLSLIYLNPWLAISLAFVDIAAIVMLQFLIANKFFSVVLIIISLILLIANHYLSAWIRIWLVERRK